MLKTVRQANPTGDEAAGAGRPTSLAEIAIDSLRRAAATPAGDDVPTIEERSVWQPDSWLIQRCWQTLAAAGEGEATLTVSEMADARHPLSSLQALYQIAQQVEHRSVLAPLIADELLRRRDRLFADDLSTTFRLDERLLLAAASAAHIQADSFAFACLERLDQFPRAWDRVHVQPALRTILAETVARVGLHPLTSHLVVTAIRRFADAGAQFLALVTQALSTQVQEAAPSSKEKRLMSRCIEAFRHATLTSLHSRRAAAVALGRAGLVDEVLAQITTIANVQDARRESGLTLRGADVEYLREVKRPNANPDMDFQAYTLREAIKAMPVRDISREQRVVLADRLAMLAVSSDGWTAAATTTPLIELGALKYAVDVIENLPAQDPTRSEGVISLVRGLLAAGEDARAAEQVESALAWAKAYDGRNPERATIWGLAEVYLEYNRPQDALHLLDARIEPLGFVARIRNLFRERVTDDRLHDDRLRLGALLRLGWQHDTEVFTLVKRLRTWAPRLLDGDALIGFYVDGLLRPLLSSGRTTPAWELIPEVLRALGASSGDKHATRVAQVATLLAGQIPPAAKEEVDVLAAGNAGGAPDAVGARAFLEQLWQADARKGLWQTVHSIEGALPLLLTLDGAEALVAIAKAADAEGAGWTKD